MPTRDCDAYAEAMARIRASKLRKAGLSGAYASADSELGRRVYALAREGRGAYLFGTPGTGKTHAAACAVRMWCDRGGVARLVTAKRLLDDVRDGYRGDGDRRALERAARVPLLALDDLGLERRTDWGVEEISALIDGRTAAGLPTVITSNYSLGELATLWGGVDGARAASRIAGACERIAVEGPDRRLHGQG